VVSTLKLTKIQIPNSDSDVISLDASSGNVTLNKTLGGTSITVQGEGTATTNLQQGLSKLFVKFSGDGTTVNASFNTGSITDSGTGYHRVNFTNNMSEVHYVTHSTTAHNYGASNNGWSSGVASDNGTNGMTTSTVQLSHGNSGGSNADPTAVHVSLDGDLA